ncbi:hypothetical protein MRB53_025713 [Persea americana]|uniref:Uncharacterized protein n=1 Tax=Persea americana TaxID=3435 RepID=A0ACC2LG74_PERAE|nr:hypothetical protein MRB53_025713 [Persea americana]
MHPESRKVIVSRDVVFDEVSAHQVEANADRSITDLAPFFGNEAFSEKGSSISPSGDNIKQDDITEAVIRKSSRQRKQPEYLTDYEVQLNHCSVLSCFLMGDACDNEPKSYVEAKGNSEWQ